MTDNHHWNGRVTLEVDLGVVANNIRAYQKAISPAEFMAVIKANGYGSWGNQLSLFPVDSAIEPVIKTCLDMGVKRFAVGRLTEAESLRKMIPSECEVLLLGNAFPEEAEGLIQNNVIVSISDLGSLNHLKEIATCLGRRVEVHILIDTGMGRLGIPYKNEKNSDINNCESIQEVISSLISSTDEQLAITGLYSHFSNAHIIDDPYTLEQIRKFMEIKDWVRSEFPRNTKDWEFHIANSWGGGNYQESHLDIVRVGIGLYGVEPQPMKWIKVKSAVTLKSRLLAKRLLPAGSFISYDCRYRLPEDTWVGTVAAGYADGIPLAFSSPINHIKGDINTVFLPGQVLIKGQRASILGKVTMDYIMVNLNQVEAVVGDEVVFFGKNGDEEISVKDFADIKGTHGYEVICSLPSIRVPRVYRGQSNL